MVIQGLNPQNNFNRLPINNDLVNASPKSSELDIENITSAKEIPNEELIDHSKIESSEDSKNIHEIIYEKLRKIIPIPGAVLSSLFHLWAAFHHLFNPQIKDRSAMDRSALNVSKTALVANCILQTIEAARKNRMIEAFSRFVEPLFILAENRIEDLGLARGIGLGISQLVGSQEGIVNELAKEKLGIDVTKEGNKLSKGEDFELNFAAMKKIFRELLSGGLGSKRRFLTGFTWSNIKNKLTEFKKHFNLSSIKELFDSRHGDYRDRFEVFLKASGLESIKSLFKGNDRDKGHTDAVSGYLMILGSLLGYMDKAGKGLFYKLGGTMRNAGGAVADIALFAHEDPDPNISAMFLSVNTVMDMLQRFIPAKMLNLILPWSNFSMAAYNIGVAIYLNRSSKKTNEGDKIKYHDTDLNLKKKSSPITKANPGVELAKVNTEKQFANAA